MKLVFYIILFINLCFQTHAQNLQIGVLGGLTVFQGDYPSYNFKEEFKILFNPGAGIFIRKPINNFLAVRGSLYFTSFSGDDKLDPSRFGNRTPTKIKYPAMEFQVNAEIVPLHILLAQKNLELFAFAGAAFSKTTINNIDISDACPIVNFLIPIGAGLRYSISDKIQISGQLEMLRSFTDCLDGVIGPTNINDWYTSGKIGLSIALNPEVGGGKNIGCPRF